MRILPLVLIGVFLANCAAPTRSRSWVAETANKRTTATIGPTSLPADSPLPPELIVTDGLDPTEAVAITLWRSPSLQAELMRLDVAIANLDEANRLPNPRLSFRAPLSPRQLALLLAVPIDAIWQRPLRTELASRELEQVAESLVQIVLDTERDVRIAHADAVLAHERVIVREQLAITWNDTAFLAAARAKAGDISLAEAEALQAEASLAEDATARARKDSIIADARLLMLMGAPWSALPSLTRETPLASIPSIEELTTIALSQRPDLKAAELAIHVEAARAKWEKSRVFTLVATLDGESSGDSLAPRFTGGLQAEIPVFTQNQGGVGRAEAAIARTGYQYAALRLTIALEVVSAAESLSRAQDSLAAYRNAENALRAALIAATRAFENGAESYAVVIDALRRETDARLRRIELEAELARAFAELIRAVGGQSLLEKK